MEAITADGQTIALVGPGQGPGGNRQSGFRLRRERGVARRSGRIVSAIFSSNPFLGDWLALLAAAANTVELQCEEAVTDQNDANLTWASAVAQNDETYQIQLGQNLVTDTGMLTQIFDSLADLGQAGVDAQQQLSLLSNLHDRRRRDRLSTVAAGSEHGAGPADQLPRSCNVDHHLSEIPPTRTGSTLRRSSGR